MSGTLTPVRVVVAEHEVLVREGIRRLFETIGSIDVVAVVEDLTSLWAAVDVHDPDVVVTDVPMAPTFTDEGIRFAVELRQLRPEIAVVVLGDSADARGLQPRRRTPRRVDLHEARPRRLAGDSSRRVLAVLAYLKDRNGGVPLAQ